MTAGAIVVVLRAIAIVALWGFLAWLILRVLGLFLQGMAESESNPKPGVWIETNWGGLGGGISGWRVSNAVIYLLVLTLLLGSLSLAVVTLTPTLGNLAGAKSETKQEGADTKQRSTTIKEDRNTTTNQTGPDKKDANQKPAEAKASEPSKAGKGQSQSSNAPDVQQAVH